LKAKGITDKQPYLRVECGLRGSYWWGSYVGPAGSPWSWSCTEYLELDPRVRTPVAVWLSGHRVVPALAGSMWRGRYSCKRCHNTYIFLHSWIQFSSLQRLYIKQRIPRGKLESDFLPHKYIIILKYRPVIIKFLWLSSRIRNPAIFLTTDSWISFTHNVHEFLWDISLPNFTCLMQVDQQETDSYRNLSLTRHVDFIFDKTVTVTEAKHISSFSHHTWYYDAKARIGPTHTFIPSPIVEKTGNVRINVTLRRAHVIIFAVEK